nr:hypothetical protein FFPRI1PSEUD_55480 [Pseudomonas sp. FFPRI_1]
MPGKRVIHSGTERLERQAAQAFLIGIHGSVRALQLSILARQRRVGKPETEEWQLAGTLGE